MLAPQQAISARDLDRGLRWLMIDSAAATAIGALNSGVVLLALALHIGASTIAIGLLAAIPLLTQVLQVPAVKLVERVRRRRLISVSAVFTARLALPIYACVPLIGDRDVAVAVLLAAALLHYGLNAVSACSWNSWMRDLVPPDQLGHFFARRGLFGTGVSAVATIGAALALDAAHGSHAVAGHVFTSLYAIGFGCGLLSTAALARVPEPQMGPMASDAPLYKLLAEPIRDRNFRNLLRYLASWQFAVNLATPFFTVYFVRELGFTMSFVLVLTVISQIANIAVVRAWGRLSDRFANKSVLSVATPVFVLCIAGVAFGSEFQTHAARAVYLIVLHGVMGAAGAGVGLASGNATIRLSRQGAATSYMAASALVSAIAAGIAPILGGGAAEFFARRQLAVHLDWTSPDGVSEIFGLVFSHWEFFFLLSALIGLYALHRLSIVDEPGAAPGSAVVEEIRSSARRTLRTVSSVAGLRNGLSFPGGELIKSRLGRHWILETLFERPFRHHRPGEAVGSLLDASFATPPPDADLDDLLKRLDARTRDGRCRLADSQGSARQDNGCEC